jgi:uncharacterized zinc-type alcohol dehydrogenase-like protein
MPLTVLTVGEPDASQGVQGEIMTFQAAAYAALKAGGPLRAHTIDRRNPRSKDVVVHIDYCGVCHSDVHKVRSEWGDTPYPIVPGHEIVGRVVKVGDQVTRFVVGDTVGVGVMVDSCRTCDNCQDEQEQYCDQGFVSTYGGKDRHDGSDTYGGYASHITTHEDFVLRIPKGMDLARTAPLLCAGITTYSPLRHFGAGPGTRVGIVGLGGLGHTAVKLARALGAHVTVITHSVSKQDEAKRLGAHAVVLSQDPQQMAAHTKHFDLLLCTISAKYDMSAYLTLLRRDGNMVVVGLPDSPPAVSLPVLVRNRLSLSGSLIGGLAETQEMLDFCHTHKILCDVEVIAMDKINEAYDRMVRSDVRYRFVIDMKTLPQLG